MSDTCESGRGQNIPNKAEWRRTGKRGGKVTRSRGLLRFNTVSERRTCALTEQQSKSTRVWLRQSTSGGMWVPVCMQNQLDFLLGQPCAARQSADPQSGWFLFLISTFFSGWISPSASFFALLDILICPEGTTYSKSPGFSHTVDTVWPLILKPVSGNRFRFLQTKDYFNVSLMITVNWFII